MEANKKNILLKYQAKDKLFMEDFMNTQISNYFLDLLKWMKFN